MASQVLSGTGDVTYTNNTGQNVRIVINFMRFSNTSSTVTADVTVSWGGVSVASAVYGGSIGRSIAGTSRSPVTAAQNVAWTPDSSGNEMEGIPLELILAPTETFSVVGGSTSNIATVTIGAYNIVVIPEAG